MAKRALMAKGDRIGLYMIIATLAVISVMITMLFRYQLESHESRIRSEAISLARVLAGVPYEELIAQRGILEVVRQSWQDGDFAYATVVGPDGAPVVEVTAPGIIVPPTAFATRPDVWISEHELPLNADTTFIEIQAPVVQEGEAASRLRLGFVKPTMALRPDQLPFFATLAFLVFLLTPIFYFLIRNEVRPLRQANERLSALVQDGQMTELNLRATGELGEFMNNFNDFIKFANERMHALEQEQTNLITKTQLLSYRKSRIETVLDSIPEAIVIIDQTGRISFANQRVESLLGVDRSDVIEKSPEEWCDHPDILDVLARYAGNQGSKQYLAQTVRIQPKKSSERNLSIKAYPLFAPNDATDIQGTLVIIRDISKELHAQQGQSEFVTHVSHELKTPLNTIALSSEQLLYDDDLSESDRIAATNIISDEVERMATLISNLLSITKIEMGELPLERRHVKLRDFLEDVFENVARSDRDKSPEFKLDIDSDSSAVFLDKDLLRIAINNLLTNAIKYSDPGGTVTLGVTESDDEIRISVTDTGIGISADDQARIFTKFFRAEDSAVRQRLGHGLGLSLAQEIVQMHNGTMTVDSELGRGSEFAIVLSKETGMLKQVI